MHQRFHCNDEIMEEEQCSKLVATMPRKVIFSRHHNNVVSYIHTITLLHVSVCMNIRYNIVVVTAEDNLSCHCDTQQDAHHEDGSNKTNAVLAH
jgi:hypothetical protein